MQVETTMGEGPPKPAGSRGLTAPWIALIVLALAALPVGSCIGCFAVGSSGVHGGNEYARLSLDAITAPWNAQALIERSSPEFLASMPPDKTRLFVHMLEEKLGALQRRASVQDGPWRVFVGTNGLSTVTIHFIDCDFEKGQARVSLTVVRRGSDRRIHGFFVNSDALLR
jgi:hypothetical protein